MSAPAGSASGKHRGGGGDGSGGGGGHHRDGGTGDSANGGGGNANGAVNIRPDGGMAATIAEAAGDAGVDFSTKAVIAAASRKTVYVVVDNVATPVTVVVGLSDGSFTEIINGSLKEGDQIATDSTDTGTAAPTPTKTTASPLSPQGGGKGGGGRGP